MYIKQSIRVIIKIGIKAIENFVIFPFYSTIKKFYQVRSSIEIYGKLGRVRN